MFSVFRRTKIIFAAATAFLIGIVPATAADGPFSGLYYVSIAGFPVGRVSFEGTTQGNRYQLQGFMGSSGFFGLFIGTRYSGAAIGTLRNGVPRPSVFRGRFEQRGQFAQVDIKYSGNRPVSVERTPQRDPLPSDVPVSKVRGHLDPISALYHVFQDRSVGELCKLDFSIFEGARTARVAMTPAGVPTAGEPVVCNGIYRRTGGFTPEQLGERNDFPFQLTYEAGEDGFYEVSDFVATTTFGVARARRR